MTTTETVLITIALLAIAQIVMDTLHSQATIRRLERIERLLQGASDDMQCD